MVDDNTEKTKDLIQLARLALAGRPQDVQTYITRMSRKYQKLVPELGEKLMELLKVAPTRKTPLRNSEMATVPTDRDSKLDLLRIESTAELEHEPIWQSSVEESLRQIVNEHQQAKLLLSQGLSPTRTVIFTGPPGVGKTLAARWLARELRRPLLTLDLSAVMSSYLGRTGANVRHVLDYAKGVSCVLLIDELDAIAKRRDDEHEVGELKRLVTVLLQEIDDWPEGGLLVAASNHPELLDPAVWRRFEVQVEFDIPARAAVEKSLKLFIDDASSLSEGWLSALSDVLAGQSYSDIEREIKLLRRQAVVKECSLSELLPILIRRHIEDQPKSAKKEIAARLCESGLSQRAINELTGLSRDTLRKMNNAE